MGCEIGESRGRESGMMNVSSRITDQLFWVGKQVLISDGDQILNQIFLINTGRRLNVKAFPVKGLVIAREDLKHAKDLSSHRTQIMTIDDAQDTGALG